MDTIEYWAQFSILFCVRNNQLTPKIFLFSEIYGEIISFSFKFWISALPYIMRYAFL